MGIRNKTMRLAGLLSGALLLPAAAPESDPSAPAAPPPAQAAASIRTGSHRDFGRVIITPEHGSSPKVSREGDRIIVTMPGQEAIPGTAAPPRNVQNLRRAAGRLEIAITPGASMKTSREGPRLVIDIGDPPAPAPTPNTGNANTAAAPAEEAEAPARPTRAGRRALPLPPIPPAIVPAIVPSIAPAVPEHTAVAITPPTDVATVQPVEVVQPPAPTPHMVPEPSPAPAWLAQAAQAPPATAPSTPPALAVRVVAAEQGGGIFIPFEPNVGAASFRRGDLSLVVFDQRRPLDLAALRGHPAFGAATVQLLAGGTLLRIPLPPASDLALTRQPQGWQLAIPATPQATEPIRATPMDGKLLFIAEAPGVVVTMADPETGATLLVGTVRRAGQAMPATRQWATFTAPRSWQGLVVEPLSDALSLRPTTEGFVLNGGPAGLPIGADTQAGDRMAQAESATRRFGFTSLSGESLRGLRRTQLLDAADAPPLARGPKRRALAQTLISLGLAAEAQTILQIAAADDPREAEAPETIGLTAIAALLAGRMDETGGLDDPGLAEGDEPRFWRAVRLAMRIEGAPEAAADFAATLKLLQSYPEPLRERLLPVVVETLALTDRADAARRLLEQALDAPSLALARALLLRANGQGEKALVALDALANGRDRLLRARAGARAAELRLAQGDLTPATAAEALEKLLFAWRGDARDLALRLRVAELRVQAGTWRPALAMLRETETQFPEEQAMIQARLRQSVAQLLQESAMERMAPLDLVALVDENAALMPDGEAGAEIAARLSDRLTALDLPRRAMPLLQKLVSTTPAGPARARFGAKLAALRLQEADAGGARAALDASGADALPESLTEERSVLAARALARLGDPVAAVARLANLDSEAALRARAGILEEAHNWPQATEALGALVARTVPGEGKLDDAQQRSLLRLATAAAQAGDSALLAQLRTRDLPRLSAGPVADLFRLLTADSVQGVADLPRAGRELALARALSADPARR